MTDADGEATETSIWLDFPLDCEYINEKEHKDIQEKYSEIGRMLNSMALNPDKFTPKTPTATATATATNPKQ
jgi:hypothetical protein